MEFNFNFEAFEQSGKEKNEAINYLKSLNSSIDFDKLESDLKGDENAIYEALKGGNFSFSKPSIEQTRQKLLKNKENEALKAEFNAGLSWLGEEKRQNFNFYDFKKAKEKAKEKQGLIQADLKEKEKQMQKKEALFETRLKERGIIAKSFDDMLDQSGAYLGADLLEKGLNKLGFKDENYIFESEKEDIKSRALKSVREKLERGDLEFNEREKHALRSKYDEPDYKKALEKEKERLRLSQKSGNFSEAEREFIENDLGFFNTLFNDDKENIKEFKEKVKSEGVISSEIIKAANTLKAFDEGNLFKNMLFADEKEKKEFQQNFLNDAYKIAELSGFDDVGLDKKGELYFIKDEQKYLVNTGFFDNFAQLLNDTKFEFAGGVLGGLKGFNSGKSAKGKVAKSILGAAAGSFGGAFLDAKIADMYLNRESDFKKNLDFAIQAGLLSMAGDGVILSVKPLAKGLYKGVKKGGEILGEYSILGTLKTLPEQNIQAAEKIIDEVFSPKMKEELKAAQEEFGGSVRGEDLKNAFFANLQKKFTQKYGENDSKTKSVAKIAEIFNTNSLKTRQQAMLDLVRSDKDGSTLAYLLEIAKDDVKIQSNLKNMLNLASSNVEKNLKNLNINAREIKHILDEFEAGNKAAFKEVESQISKLYDENYRVVLSKGEYENIKEEFRQNGVNLEEMTPFLRDLEANVFNEKGVSFTQLNNFRKNLNFYIYNRDKTPNFINTLKKIGENILKNEIDKGIDNIFSQNKAAYESIKELYSTSLKDYATLKSLNESIKNLKLQDSAKSADEVLNSLIKYAKGQGEKGVNNLQKIKDYLGEENNAFLEMQILNKLFKESVVENDRAMLRVFDSEGFLNRVKELVGDTPAKYALNKDEAKLFLENLNGAKIPKKLDIEGFLKELESVENKENFISHLSKKEDAQSRLAYLNLVEPTLKEADLILHNGKRQDYIKKFNDGKDFFTLLITEENGKRLITFLPKTREDFIKNKIDNASLIQSFTSRASKQGNGLANESITQPLFKSKEAREFLELVEGFHKLYKNDASIAKNLVQGTSEKLSTSIATSAEGAIKQKVVKGAFDPIFRLLPDKILFGLFAKQIQGGALRYHLKKALSRSLNYDDFKIKLEKELKRTNFNSNTSRLIDEFMQNLDTFNAEKEAKLAKIREEQARINTIKTAQENAYNAQEANLGNDILEPSSLKEDFGENFAGYKGKEAVEKLLAEQRGQVKGAFYKEGLGEIDLVWGEITDLEKHKGYGLAHILDKRKSEFVEQGASQSEAAQKAAEFAKNEISNIMQNGKIINKANEATRIETQDYRLILKQNWKGEPTKNKWLVTAYMKKEKGESISSTPFTKEDNLSLNSKESIAQKAKNDEVLEAEVIEEVGLNEPMKFLEFQQRKLLTYIKENTPLKLLEHKKELKTRDILNFLEQSALNGKQKVFLMRNLERDLGKLELKIKENESVKAKIKNTYEISQSEAKELGEHFNFKGKKPLLRELRENEIKHALKSHGNKESEEARGNIAITLQDIEANYPKITQEYDEKFFTQKGVIYVKQVNGHHIVIEEALSGQDKLIFKTMWKTKGNYNKEVLLKNAKTSPYPQNADEAVRLETISKQELEQSNPQQSHLSTDQSIAQNSEKLPFETQTLDEDKLSGDEVRHLANKIGEKSTMAYFKDYLLKMDKNFHARAKDIIREYYKIEPFRKELENQWENVKAAYKNGEMSLKEFKFLSKYKDEKSFLNQVAGVLWLQNDELVKNRGYTINKYGLTEQGKGDNYYQNLALEYGKAQTALKKWFYYIQKANKQAQRFFNKKELEDLRANEKAQKLEAKGSEDITDKKGKEHTLTKETQKAWLEAFGLKSLDEEFIPNFKAEVKEALKSVLNGEEIKLTKGSLIKLIKEKRLKYLDRIKPTLENPHSVILQNDGALIFARDYGEEKYFTSVARNDSGEWIIRSNAPKSKNGLNNKILNGGKEIYNDQAASQINASNPYDDIANSNIKLDNESIAENADYLELVKEYGEENAKRIIKQKILGENIAQVLENEEEKFIYKKGDREFEFKIKDAMQQFEMQYDELNLKSDLNKSFLKALNKLKIGYEVLENEPVRIRYFKQEAKERKPKETKPSVNKTLGKIQKDMSARLKELKAQAKENYERYKNEDKALQKELTNTKDLFKAFEKEFNETEGTILISRAKRRKNDAEGKVETSVFLGNELALRNALDRWERYSGYSEENALEVKERLELLRSYVKRLEKHREDIKAKREQLEQDYQQNEAARSKEMGVIGNYNILSNLKGVSENELYEPFLEKIHGFLSKADFYERHLPFIREEFQKLFNITPLKEFGTNYAEFYRDGKGAAKKLLAEKGGQVAGAFYKEGLGEIDLVWGDENFGLRHIIDKHGDEFEDIAAELDEIIAKGVLEKGEHRYFIKHNDYRGMIALDYKGKESNAWILTLYKDKSALNPAYQHQIKHNTNTSSETRANGEFENFNIKNANLQKEKVDKLFHGDAEVISAQGKFNELEALNLTDEDIIPQQKIKFAMEKFHYDEKKAKDLLEWHKNSHALTKDENGLPKVFYHGSGAKFEVFEKKFDEGKMGFFFADREILAEDFAKDKGGNIIYPAFLKIKNPIWLSYEKQGDKWVFDWLDDESKKLLKEAQEQGLSIGFFQKDFKFKDFLISRGYDGIVVKTKLGGRLDHVVFDSNQIKHIDNKGSFTDTKGNVTSKKPKNKEAEFSYFNEKSDNIYHSNPHLGAGLVGGTLNGVEQDENGNLSFDPVKFAMGFLGGSGGSFALKKGFQILEKNPELKEKIINELAHTLAQGFEKAREKYSLLNLLEPRYIVKNEKGRKIQAKTMLKELQREQKGLYNVAFNGKNASLIKQDLQSVESAIAFMQGTRYKGAKHERIKHLTDPSKEGYVTDLEFVNLGKSIREFLKNYEPFIDTNGARLYEWENKDKVRFRVVVNDVADMDSNPTTATEEIITFYSDRNLKEKMNFKNPLLKDTIAQASIQGEALSKELEKSFLDESGRIAYKSLMQNAEKLPKELNLRAFREQFKGQKYAIIKTPIKDVKINTDYAFYHLLKSGNGKENRKYISGGILATLQNPLFVTKDERGSYYFYKPFKINENLINLVSVEVDKNDKLLYKTSYEASKNKLKSMIEKYDLIYFAGGIQPVRAE
ncbi:PBECR2 nuclease fold domain-containing protein [Campylobacter upsaliensis]